MDLTNEQQLVSNSLTLELQQQYHFMTQLTSNIRIESQPIFKDDNDAPKDYWGDGWSDDDDDDELGEHQLIHPKVDQEHTNDDDDGDYYAKWSEHLGSASCGSEREKENNLAALQELIRLLHQTLPAASTSMTTLNPLPKVIQYRYEWDEPNQ